MPIWTSYEKTKPVPDRVTVKGGMGTIRAWGVFLLMVLLAVIPLKLVAAESAYECGQIPCENIETDLSNIDSLQRGHHYLLTIVWDVIQLNICVGVVFQMI